MAARRLEGGLKFALGSTLAVQREALVAAGGFAPLAEYLADDYEIGVRVARGLQHCAVPRSGRDRSAGLRFPRFLPAPTALAARHEEFSARRIFRHADHLRAALGVAELPGERRRAVEHYAAEPGAAGARTAVALGLGVGMLRDRQVLRDFWLLPLRDCMALLLWLWSYADDTVVWRGERYRLLKGKLHKI